MPPAAALKTVGASVYMLYKRLEILANNVVAAIAISVTYRKHEKAEIRVVPVTATNFSLLQPNKSPALQVAGPLPTR